ncbi:hypothetical protein PFICI_11556 [Pestalotiopsis fici W106-1]|uniref:Protein kinase domain-containing protein n=1 Tax=Pestalotiopsis fici (strain W106-1 / CGMCC3.15140) TaxID=1229662 RepID=W3WQS5_PESFW|nr:uncharacterized protein PFICI_11556 [Pestalotiopsis fici W106-1]ETS76169.1 hypothetical protein PFICI_11556 [Pestalotiopsis fici W106-1]
MSGAELPLAIVGAVDLCIKYGSKLMKLCAAFRGANNEITERILRLETGWFKTELQLDFMRRVPSLMGGYHRQLNEKIVETLQIKLNVVTTKIERVIKLPEDDGDESTAGRSNSSVKAKRWKYALFKESIDEAIEELELWQRTADPSWYLILKIANSQVDQALKAGNTTTAASFPSTRAIRAGLQSDKSSEASGIFLPAQDLESMTVQRITFCEAKAATRNSTRKGPQNFLLAPMECPPIANRQLVKRNLRDLARKLQHNDPGTFGLLSCKGVVEQLDSTDTDAQQRVSFTMVFRAPNNLSNPKSLRDLLLSDRDRVALSDKFDIARQMATAISYVHTFGFVHKNMRPETLISYVEPQKSSSPNVYLLGFEDFRKEEGKTYRIGDDYWEKNLYRHPSRQGPTPDSEYIMQHDIYSLGVCLLEVGLWSSFVLYDAEAEKVTPASVLGLSQHDGEMSQMDFTNTLLDLSRGELPRCMGRKYASIVETCLTCLNPDNIDFGDERDFMDDDGVLVGVRYIEKVKSNALAYFRGTTNTKYRFYHS